MILIFIIITVAIHTFMYGFVYEIQMLGETRKRGIMGLKIWEKIYWACRKPLRYCMELREWSGVFRRYTIGLRTLQYLFVAIMITYGEYIQAVVYLAITYLMFFDTMQRILMNQGLGEKKYKVVISIILIIISIV